MTSQSMIEFKVHICLCNNAWPINAKLLPTPLHAPEVCVCTVKLHVRGNFQCMGSGNVILKPCSQVEALLKLELAMQPSYARALNWYHHFFKHYIPVYYFLFWHGLVLSLYIHVPSPTTYYRWKHLIYIYVIYT